MKEFSEEHRRNLSIAAQKRDRSRDRRPSREVASQAQIRSWQDPDIRARRRKGLSKSAIERNAGVYFRGGKAVEEFAVVLLPAGFVREFRVQYGPKCGDHFLIDFAHPEGKIAIELDSPLHGITWAPPKTDTERDAILRSLGWKVIRIRHDL